MTDISDKLTYERLATQAYMGGSVFYNPDSPSEGQLADGAHIAIRLGKVTKKIVDDEDEFSDVPEKEVIGYLTVSSIDEHNISFTCKFYNKEGEIIQNSDFSLDINNTIDINGDSKPDLEYRRPASKRPGLESAIYLNFLSSQELLNTTMFAILSEQYSRGVYPSGIIGINTNGRFIVEKYEGTSKNRSMVKGIVSGDYVLDSEKGVYQSVSKNIIARNARVIEDSELQGGEDISKKSFYFDEKEFSEDMKPQTLLENLPTSITSTFPAVTTIEEAIEILNKILKMNNMIKVISDYRGEVLQPEELETINDTSALTENELVSLNRLYLCKTYPEVCPQIESETNNIADVLPLASANFSNDEEPVSDDSLSRQMSTNYNQYERDRTDIENQFKSYKRLGALPIPKLIGKKVEGYEDSIVRPGALKVELGIGGHLSITWSNMRSKLVVVVLLQAETVLQLGKDNELVNLIPAEFREMETWGYSGALGPIPYRLSFPLQWNAPIKAGGYANFTINTFAGVTGIYGAGCSIGADYSVRMVKWFKVWRKWVYRPQISYDQHFTPPFVIGKTAAFVGLQGNWGEDNTPFVMEEATSYLSFTPSLAVGPRLTIGSGWDQGPYIELQAKTGMEFLYTVSTLPYVDSLSELIIPKKFYLTGNIEAIQKNRLGFVAGFYINLPIVGKKNPKVNFGEIYNVENTFFKLKLF